MRAGGTAREALPFASISACGTRVGGHCLRDSDSTDALSNAMQVPRDTLRYAG